ncbi:hypothetical protein Y032_0131g1601 [Ancylostoma ceylanicum]|uniref:Tc1-like transposase DDE domain-containing protein n=1 Tax=Ancylostoma ceylanicum TaxID=53326 RepID=A0A016T717_9BILA|nr:hypothetical protein Y032_0131g1601 [Ancylostoma ceylanicum]
MPHVAKVVKADSQELDWEVLMHPSYRPDLAPTDYHLFRSLSNQMRGLTFKNEGNLGKKPTSNPGPKISGETA